MLRYLVDALRQLGDRPAHTPPRVGADATPTAGQHRFDQERQTAATRHLRRLASSARPGEQSVER